MYPSRFLNNREAATQGFKVQDLSVANELCSRDAEMPTWFYLAGLVKSKCYIYYNVVCSVCFLLRVPHSIQICHQIRITTKKNGLMYP